MRECADSAADWVPAAVGPGNNRREPGQPWRCTQRKRAHSPWSRSRQAARSPRQWTGRTALRRERPKVSEVDIFPLCPPPPLFAAGADAASTHVPSKLTRAMNPSRPVKSSTPAKASARPSGVPRCRAADRQLSTGGATSSRRSSSTLGRAMARAEGAVVRQRRRGSPGRLRSPHTSHSSPVRSSSVGPHVLSWPRDPLACRSPLARPGRRPPIHGGRLVEDGRGALHRVAAGPSDQWL